MDYKEKYKEALKRAKRLYEQGTITESLGFVFPELVEIESEKIREEIIAFLYSKNGYMTPNEDWDFHNRWLAWLEKQGEQTTDKVEQKFKVGDWVIFNGTVAKILDKQKYGFVGLDIDRKDFFCNYGHTDSMRLWSINDANDGDVLVNSKGNPFIFTGKFTANYHNPIAYCGIGNENKFIVCALSWRFHWAEKKEVAPATKEQRELLFQKMKEAGYVWDADKKELKKVESKKLDPDKVIAWLVANICNYDYYVKLFKEDFGL